MLSVTIVARPGRAVSAAVASLYTFTEVESEMMTSPGAAPISGASRSPISSCISHHPRSRI